MNNTELTRAVAEALGWTGFFPSGFGSDGLWGKNEHGWARPVPAYATDIAAAFTLLDEFEHVTINKMTRGWLVYLEQREYELEWERQSKTLPRAICLAFLAAKGVSVG